MASLRAQLSFLLPGTAFLLVSLAGGWPSFGPLVAAFLVFALFPGIDLLFSSLEADPRIQIKNQKTNSTPLRDRIWAWLYALAFLYFLSQFWLEHTPMHPLLNLAQAVSWGILSGVLSLIVGHSLIHSRHSADKKLGSLLFLSVLYPSFPLFHIKIHHRHLATREDFHSARKDESFYRFFGRSFRNEACYVLNELSLGERIQRALPLLLLFVFIGMSAGLAGIIRALAVGVVSRLMIQMVNYVQHYGLSRKSDEPFSERHSWELPFHSTNRLLFNAGFHSEHHLKGSVPTSLLKLSPSPHVMPYNFPLMMALALWPRHFFSVMDPLITKEMGNDGSL